MPSKYEDNLPTAGLPAAQGSSPAAAAACRSCAAPLQGPFCHVCGIKAPRLPLTLAGMWQDFTERVLHIEKSLKRTVGHLCWQPGVVFKAFMQGQRLSYTHPMPFLVAIATISVVLTHFFGDAYFDAYRASLLQQVKGSLSPARSALYAQLNVWLSLSMPYWMLIFTLPAAGLMRLLFPKRGFTVAEAWAVGLYGVAMAMLIVLPVSGLGQWTQMSMAKLRFISDLLLLLIPVGYYLAWLGFWPWTLLRVLTACLFGFVLMDQVQKMVVYQIAAWMPGIH